MIKILDNNKLLYHSDKINYEKSLEYAKTLNNRDNDLLIFHCFWRVPKEFGFKQVSVIKSIIVNHKNKLDKIEINLWSNVDLSDNPYFKEISKYVNLKLWNMEEEIKNTVLEDCIFLKEKNRIDDTLCYLEGDLFRLLVLHKYGGFYIDMDVLVLRDMSPLNNFEFLYQWGTSGVTNQEPTMSMNGAVMRLNKNSNLSVEFLELIKNNPPIKNTTSWGNKLYSKIKNNDILVLPGVWFNSEWGFENTVLSPFKKIDTLNLFEGAFTWHWHNRWDDIIEEGSKFDILSKEHDEEFKNIL
jgi:hypothetical protein